ncbi:TPA: hypothetical protein DCY65_00245 [Candidatus Acetothermia bacterium]|nr:hypothetical protein [Candidatus Acetothermia bacterium]
MRTMRRMSVVVLGAVVAVGAAWAQPTGEDLVAWAFRHWDDVGSGRLANVVGWFGPEAGLAFLGTPGAGFYYGPDVAAAWRAFFAEVLVQGYALTGVTRAIPESGLVHGTLELATDRGPVVVDSYLRFSGDGMLLAADYVVTRGFALPVPVADGVVGGEEYRNAAEDRASGVVLHWTNGLVVLHAALRSPGTGWVAAGFDPVDRMQGANYVIAAVTATGLVIEDHYGTRPTSHRRDARDHVLRAGGNDECCPAVVEFVIPLDSSDPEDKALVPGQTYTVLLAYHRNSKSFTVFHTRRGSVTMTLEE